MQPFYISRVIGKPFAVKFDGEIVPINHDMILTVGDVFSVRDGKNAWFVLQNGEQIDVLNRAYVITTKSITALETSAELVYTKPSDDEESPPQYQLKTEGLVQHGLSNTQAKALILTRHEDYFNSLQVGEDNKAKFEPQVYRISENQYMDINVKDLSSFISGAKSKNFSISSIIYEDKECELTYDSEHFTIVPRVSPSQEIKIKLDLTNGIQYITGMIVFVVQPVEADFNIKMITHQIKFINIKEKILVADIISEGFDEKLIEFDIVNDPNHYFFTIENKQLFLTTEGIKAIINKTISLDEMQVTVRATNNNRSALATIEIPFNSDFYEQITKSNINPIESARNEQTPTTENVEVKQPDKENIDIKIKSEKEKTEDKLIEAQNNESEVAEKQKIEDQTTKKEETNNIITETQKIDAQTRKIEETNNTITETQENKPQAVEKQKIDIQTTKAEGTNNIITETQEKKSKTVEKQNIDVQTTKAEENNNTITETQKNKSKAIEKQKIDVQTTKEEENNNTIAETQENKPKTVDKQTIDAQTTKKEETNSTIAETQKNKLKMTKKQKIDVQTNKAKGAKKQKIENQISKTKETNNIIGTQTNKAKESEKQKIEIQTNKPEKIKNKAITAKDIKKSNKKISDKESQLLIAPNNVSKKHVSNNTHQLKEKINIQSKTTFENNNHDQTDNKIPLKKSSTYAKKQLQNVERHSLKRNPNTVPEKKEQKIEKEKAVPVEPYHFHLDRNNITTEHIANFVPTHDSINLTAILALKEKKDVNKHLYIEKDKSGKMTLSVSPAGNGEINTQFIFDDININKIAQFYDLNISNLSEEQISHVIIDSMLENANLIVSASRVQSHAKY